jgi:hypothetical protein
MRTKVTVIIFVYQDVFVSPPPPRCLGVLQIEGHCFEGLCIQQSYKKLTSFYEIRGFPLWGLSGYETEWSDKDKKKR